MEGPTTPYGNRIVTSAFLIYGNFYDEIYSSRVDEPSAIGKCRIFASECRQQIESGNKLAYRECAALHGGPAVTTDR